ncbi:MAG: PQQ-binding-like beta-propeller repeat protein [Planctomycetota bacterium]
MALALATGCASSERFGPRADDSSRPGAPSSIQERADAFAIDHDAFAALGYRIDWRGFPAVAPGERVRFMNLFGDTLLVQESGSTVTAMDPDTGEVRWANQLAGPLTLFVGNSRILDRFYISGEPELYVLDVDTGTLLDRQSYEKVVATNPIIAGRVLIYGTPSGEILAHLTANSIKYWGFDGRGAIEHSPVRIDRAIGAVTRSGDVLFVNAENGSLIGRGEIFRGPGAEPVAGAGLMLVPSLDRSLYAFSPEGAELRWRYRTDTPLRTQPTVHDDTVYIAVESEGLVALDAVTGEPRWRSPDVLGVVIAHRAGRLVVWDADTREAATLDPESGEVLSRATLDGVQSIHAEPFLDGPLWVVSDGGVIARFRPRF